MNSKPYLVAIIVSLSVVGCGGGGGATPTAATPPASGSSPAPSPSPSPAPSPAPSPTPVPVQSAQGLPANFTPIAMFELPTGLKILTASSAIATSVDGANYAISQEASAPTNVTRIRKIGAQFVGTKQDGGIVKSTDGITWTSVSSSSTLVAWDIAFDGTHYVLAGSAQSGTDRGIFTSSNLTSWSSVMTAALGETKWKSVAYGSGKFVAVSDNGKIVRSSDGTTWAEVHSMAFSTGLQQVAYFAKTNRFIAVGNGGSILSSADGTIWTLIVGGSLPNFLQLSCSTDKCLAVSAPGSGASDAGKTYLVSSDDGIAWNASAVLNSSRVTVAGFYNGVWVVAGENGYLLTSTNAIAWTQIANQ
jgi:hypothetical protein